MNLTLFCPDRIAPLTGGMVSLIQRTDEERGGTTSRCGEVRRGIHCLKKGKAENRQVRTAEVSAENRVFNCEIENLNEK
jgi:hypothetical protein